MSIKSYLDYVYFYFRLILGLGILGIHQQMNTNTNTNVMKTAFVNNLKEEKLTAMKFDDLFMFPQTTFSCEGSHRYLLERKTQAWWKDWLLDIESGGKLCCCHSISTIYKILLWQWTVSVCNVFGIDKCVTM